MRTHHVYQEPDLVFEQYRLVLTHEYVKNGKLSLIETPIEVIYSVDRIEGAMQPIIVNQMIDTLKHFMLEKVKEGRNNESLSMR